MLMMLVILHSSVQLKFLVDAFSPTEVFRMFRKFNLKILPENPSEIKIIKNDENRKPCNEQGLNSENSSVIKYLEGDGAEQSKRAQTSETDPSVANMSVQDRKKKSHMRVLRSIKGKWLSTFARQQSSIDKTNRKNIQHFTDGNVQLESSKCVVVNNARTCEKIEKNYEVPTQKSKCDSETGHQCSTQHSAVLPEIILSSNREAQCSSEVTHCKPSCAGTVLQDVPTKPIQILSSTASDFITSADHAAVPFSNSAQLSSVAVVHPWISSFDCSNIGQHFKDSCPNFTTKHDHDLLLPNLLDSRENTSRYAPVINDDFKIRQKSLESIVEDDTLPLCENKTVKKKHYFHEQHLQKFPSPHLKYSKLSGATRKPLTFDISKDHVDEDVPDVTQCSDLSELTHNSNSVDAVAKVREDPIGAHCAPLPSGEERMPTKSWSQEFRDFSKQSWYWGPLTRHEAEEKLAGCSDGVFLVRDSSDDRYLLSLSFRSFGKTYHTRIEHSYGLFSFNPPREHEGFATLSELINSCMAQSSSGVLCYSKARSSTSPGFPVRLCTPLSRATQVQPLQNLCSFVILQHTRLDLVPRLPLPPSLTRLLAHKHR